VRGTIVEEGPALRTNYEAQPQLAGRPLHPLVLTERSAPLDAHSQPRQFLRAQRRIHSIGPIHRAFHRPRREDGLDRIVPRNPRPEIPGTPYRTPEMSMVSPELLRRMTNCHRLPARIVIAIWFAHRFARAWIRLLPKRIRVW